MCGVSCSTRVTSAWVTGRDGLFAMEVLFLEGSLTEPGKATLSVRPGVVTSTTKRAAR